MFNNNIPRYNNINMQQTCSVDPLKCKSCKNKYRCPQYSTYIDFLESKFLETQKIEKEIEPIEENTSVPQIDLNPILDLITEKSNEVLKQMSDLNSNTKSLILNLDTKLNSISTNIQNIQEKNIDEYKNINSKVDFILEIFKKYDVKSEDVQVNTVQTSSDNNISEPISGTSTEVAIYSPKTESSDTVLVEKTKKGLFGLGKKTEWVEVPRDKA